jgi:hypothetical protein
VTEFPDWKRRDNFSVDAHQRMIDGLRKLFNVPNAGVGGKYQPDEPRIGAMVVVNPAQNAPGGGKYFGVMRIPKYEGDVNPNTKLAEADIGRATTPADVGINCLILNVSEVDKDTHDLTNGGQTVKNFIGFINSRNADGRWVVVINGYDIEDCQET